MAHDTYTAEILRRIFNAHKQYVLQLKNIQHITNVHFRLPNMPEHISENITKFIIRRLGDASCSWDGARGDLVSTVEGRQEVKCFTSDGPPSFTPTSNWDVIYFLDGRDWINDHFVLHRVKLQRTSDDWKSIKVSRAQTFDDQAREGRRPRITWDSLYPQIAKHTTMVFDGKFDEIFEPVATATATAVVSDVASAVASAVASDTPAPEVVATPPRIGGTV
jgi:hypothetical protein